VSTLGECWNCQECDIESDAELRLRCCASDALGGFDTCPPPELYDECMAAGTWPVCVSKEMAESHWAKKREKSGG
jgi:hypothetical protein